MVHVYGLSDSARENVSTAARIAADVSQPNAADVDSQGRFPDERSRPKDLPEPF